MFGSPPPKPQVPPRNELTFHDDDGVWEGSMARPNDPLGLLLFIKAGREGPTNTHVGACDAVLARLPELQGVATPALMQFIRGTPDEAFELDVAEFGTQREVENGKFALIFSRTGDDQTYKVSFDQWRVRGVDYDES